MNKYLSIIAGGLAISASIYTSAVCAATYSATYNFDQPQISITKDGEHIISIPDTYLDEKNPGSPAIPVKLSNIYIPENETVVDISVTSSGKTVLPGI